MAGLFSSFCYSLRRPRPGAAIARVVLTDLRGRVAVGTGQGPGLWVRSLGEQSGAEAVTLGLSQLPAHVHALNAATASATVKIPTHEIGGVGSEDSGSGDYGLASGPGALAMYADTNNPPVGHLPVVKATVGLSGQTSVAGQNLPVSVMPPFLGLNYIICLAGIYPSRN